LYNRSIGPNGLPVPQGEPGKIFEKVFICCSSYRNCITFTLYFQM